MARWNMLNGTLGNSNPNFSSRIWLLGHLLVTYYGFKI